jgi:spermidine/putrescine transport system permease protein
MSGPASTVAEPNGRRLLTGWFVCFLIFLYLPSVILLIFSFNSGTVPVFPLQSFTTRWYTDAWHDQELRDAFVRSIKVGLGTSIVATIVGILAAYPIARRRFRGRNVVTAFALVPLVVPPIVVASRS